MSNRSMIHVDSSQPIKSSRSKQRLRSKEFHRCVSFASSNSHFDMNRKGRDREGYVIGGVQQPRSSGFTEDTKVLNPLSSFVDERVTRYGLDPYQVRYVHWIIFSLSLPSASYRARCPYSCICSSFRSLRARDPFFDDTTHDNKGRLQKPLETF